MTLQEREEIDGRICKERTNGDWFSLQKKNRSNRPVISICLSLILSPPPPHYSNQNPIKLPYWIRIKKKYEIQRNSSPFIQHKHTYIFLPTEQRNKYTQNKTNYQSHFCTVKTKANKNLFAVVRQKYIYTRMCIYNATDLEPTFILLHIKIYIHKNRRRRRSHINVYIYIHKQIVRVNF